RSKLADSLARPRRSGEGNHVDAGMRGQRFADYRAKTGYKIEHASRQSGFIDDLRENKCSQRRNLAWLQYDGATGGERGRDLCDDLMKRIIPRRNAPYDANRLL